MGASRQRYGTQWTDWRGLYGTTPEPLVRKQPRIKPQRFDQIMGTVLIMLPIAFIAYWVMV